MGIEQGERFIIDILICYNKVFKMIELAEKFVFHIPLYKYSSGELVSIELDGLLDELKGEFHDNGFDSLYISEVKSMYKSRCFDELLITLFADSKLPAEIFEVWFRKNNDVLGQESFGYELANRMIIHDLM